MITFDGGRYWDRTSDLFGVNAAWRPLTCSASLVRARDGTARMQSVSLLAVAVVTQLVTQLPWRRPSPHVVVSSRRP